MLYDKNVLGTNGPRKMHVMLPGTSHAGVRDKVPPPLTLPHSSSASLSLPRARALSRALSLSDSLTHTHTHTHTAATNADGRLHDDQNPEGR